MPQVSRCILDGNNVGYQSKLPPYRKRYADSCARRYCINYYRKRGRAGNGTVMLCNSLRRAFVVIRRNNKQSIGASQLRLVRQRNRRRSVISSASGYKRNFSAAAVDPFAREAPYFFFLIRSPEGPSLVNYLIISYPALTDNSCKLFNQSQSFHRSWLIKIPYSKAQKPTHAL